MGKLLTRPILLIDNQIDKITMYRLVLYILIFLVGLTSILGFYHLLPYSPQRVIFTSLYLTIVCLITNYIFAYFFAAPVNVESPYITALILTLIVAPVYLPTDLLTVGWVGVLSMASKYILTIGKKHLFNPAAISVALTSLVLGFPADWWVGSKVMAPFLIICTYLIARKLRHEYLVVAFLIVAGLLSLSNLHQLIFQSSLWFFAGIMLTEPLTTPPTRNLQILYGALVGIFFAPSFHLWSFYFTPEQALLIGNLLAYLVSPKYKLILHLKEKIQQAPNIADFLFPKPANFAFTPGQYMEWTLAHPHPDDRGNRRYFTLASSPTEDTIRVGVKFETRSSSYKNFLSHLASTTSVVASQVAGDFTLPQDPKRKLVFVAGGIGVTPYRSMTKYLIDSHQPRNIVLLYFAKDKSEFVYQDVFNEASQVMPFSAHYLINRLSAEDLKSLIPDYKDRIFYLSGPHGLVVGYEDMLSSLNLPKSHIKTDYFPGFA